MPILRLLEKLTILREPPNGTTCSFTKCKTRRLLHTFTTKRRQNHSVLPLRCKMMQNLRFQHIFFKVRKMSSKWSQNVRKWFLSVLWVPKDSKQTSNMFIVNPPKIFQTRIFYLGSHFFKGSSAWASFSSENKPFSHIFGFEIFCQKFISGPTAFREWYLGPIPGICRADFRFNKYFWKFLNFCIAHSQNQAFSSKNACLKS